MRRVIDSEGEQLRDATEREDGECAREREVGRRKKIVG